MVSGIMKISEAYDKDVYTDNGTFFGKIKDVMLGKYMIHGWIVSASPNSLIKRTIGAQAIIVPHKAVVAIGDIMIISHRIEISKDEDEEDEEEEDLGKKKPSKPF